MPRAPAPTAELHARLTELELRYMEQARLVETLDEIVREQAARIDALERELHEMLRRQADLDAG